MPRWLTFRSNYRGIKPLLQLTPSLPNLVYSVENPGT